MYENTFLGVIIDHKFCWKSHINHVKTKMSKSIAILNRIKHILNEKNVIYIVFCAHSSIHDLLCGGHTHKTNLNSIYMLQKKANRIVKRVDYYEPTNKLFINLHALKLVDLVDLYTVHHS